jgi:hypothetical protein
MEKFKYMLNGLLLLGLITIMFSGCYYDVAEELYPAPAGGSGCDTANVTYSASIAPIMLKNCATSGCHVGATPADGSDLTTYGAISDYISNNRFYSSIIQDGNASNMPKGGTKLSDCDIRIIKKWMDNGALNN